MQHCICFKNCILHLPDISKWSLMENQDAFLCGAGATVTAEVRRGEGMQEHFWLSSRVQRFQVPCEDRRALCICISSCWHSNYTQLVRRIGYS